MASQLLRRPAGNRGDRAPAHVRPQRLRETGAAALDLPRAVRRRRRRGLDVLEALERRSDLAEFRPRIASDVEIKHVDDALMLANPRDLVHVRLSTEDEQTLAMMDGTRTVRDIVVERFHDSGDLALGTTVDLVLTLHEGGFLEQRFIDVGRAVQRAIEPARGRRLRRFLSTLTVYWDGADGFVRSLYERGLKHLLTPPAVIAMLAIALAGLATFIALVVDGRFAFSEESVALEGLIVLGLNYVLVFLHELGHAVVLVHFGRRIKSAGFQIYFGSPAFLIESSDVLMLGRKQRIQQAMAGVIAESTVAGTAALVAAAAPDLALSHILYKFAVLNYFYVFLNLVPLLELDGYWILSDAIGVPDLRRRSLSFVRSELWRKLAARERFTKVEAGLAAYGIVGVAFTVVVMYWSFFFWRHLFGGLISTMWNGGVASRAILLVLALVVGGPLIRGAVALVKAARRAAARWLDSVRFRLQRAWRIEAAELIDGLPMFDGLDEEALSDLAGRVGLRSFAPGEAVVRQGERGDGFYIIRSGAFEVVQSDDAGRERVQRTLGWGDAFGDVALVESQARRATVRAVTDGEVFEIGKGTFDRILLAAREAAPLGPTLQDLSELKALPCFSHLEPDQLAELMTRGAWRDVAPRERLVKQGESGDAFYVIASGQVEVVKNRHVVGSLGAGRHFGELALLSGEPRAATVRAATPVRAFRLDREGFDRFLRSAFQRGKVRTTLVGGARPRGSTRGR